MKFWKNWPYWVRGGVLLGLPGLIISIYFAFGLARFSCGFSGGCGSDFTRLLTFLKPEYFLETFLIVFLPSILLGMLAGWFYSKIKNRRNNFVAGS